MDHPRTPAPDARSTTSPPTRRSVLGAAVATTAAVTGSLGATSASADGRPAPAGAGTGPRGAVTHRPPADTTSVLRNPLTGWVLYGTGDPDDDYWSNYDALVVPGREDTVRVADYAHTLYFRLAWTVLNPEEGVYGWDVHEGLRTMIEGAEARGMRLAFRVVVDSRDKSSDFTPPYVRAAGAQGYETQTGSTTVWSPYPDDPVFQEKYGTFVRALGERFDDPSVVDFVDGYGLGKWGEGHSMRYLDDSNRESVFHWSIDLYSEVFARVPLAINYHRMIGGTKDWGDPDPGSAALLEYAISKGYMLRHDAFGMTTYYGQWERDFVSPWIGKLPIMFEGGWVTQSHSFWDDPRGYETVEDVRRGEYEDAIEAHVNTMDFRINETASWFEDVPELVDDFIAHGGYRLQPTEATVPSSVRRRQRTSISHTWANLGWGVFPAGLPQWEGKYKVAFALLDADHRAVELFVDESAHPETWTQGETYEHSLDVTVRERPGEHASWGVAIIDTHAKNLPAIQLAAEGERTDEGWLLLGGCSVR
ncbi:DUF4832 domain-containing protein [Brachybacterium sp. NPDC056505]|uniref:DUF4832 domain-containing protein n=1 Tax=Brachybacterium sp. NPDC056505 TaxID=3345843 RepID=UPI003670B169